MRRATTSATRCSISCSPAEIGLGDLGVFVELEVELRDHRPLALAGDLAFEGFGLLGARGGGAFAAAALIGLGDPRFDLRLAGNGAGARPRRRRVFAARLSDFAQGAGSQGAKRAERRPARRAACAA